MYPMYSRKEGGWRSQRSEPIFVRVTMQANIFDGKRDGKYSATNIHSCVEVEVEVVRQLKEPLELFAHGQLEISMKRKKTSQRWYGQDVLRSMKRVCEVSAF
jgi:hypothetical protein